MKCFTGFSLYVVILVSTFFVCCKTHHLSIVIAQCYVMYFEYKSHDKTINEEMVSEYPEVWVYRHSSFKRDPTMILLSKKHAPKKKKLFYAF